MYETWMNVNDEVLVQWRRQCWQRWLPGR